MSAAVKDHGLLNRTIDALSFELHFPGYQFYVPRTHLEKRLVRGDQGRSLDAVCREHDIAYSHSNDLVADKILAEKARKRIIARNSTLGENCCGSHLGSNESYNKNRHGYEDESEDEEKDSEKTSISDSEML